MFIERIIVGRKYEKDTSKIKEIKDKFPSSYICDLNWKVIR